MSNTNHSAGDDNDEERPKKTSEYTWRLFAILIIGLVLIVVGAIAEENYDSIHPKLASLATFAHVVKEVGFAFVIGFVIAFAIDLVSTREFIETVNQKINSVQRNVFRATYGREMADGLINEVEKLVLDANFVRRGHRITYRLAKARARDLDLTDHLIPDIGIVHTEVILWYDVENISSLPKPYHLKLAVEKPPYEQLGRFVAIDSLVVNGDELSKDEIKKLSKDCPGHLELTKTIVIDAKQSISVRSSWRTIKLTTDVELWRSFLPSDGMTLCVYFPEGTVAKDASAIHRTPVIARHIGNVYCEWAIEGAVLPQQGILFWWRCEEGALGPIAAT